MMPTPQEKELNPSLSRYSHYCPIIGRLKNKLEVSGEFN